MPVTQLVREDIPSGRDRDPASKPARAEIPAFVSRAREDVPGGLTRAHNPVIAPLRAEFPFMGGRDQPLIIERDQPRMVDDCCGCGGCARAPAPGV